jgi:hypothetical protein
MLRKTLQVVRVTLTTFDYGHLWNGFEFPMHPSSIGSILEETIEATRRGHLFTLSLRDWFGFTIKYNMWLESHRKLRKTGESKGVKDSTAVAAVCSVYPSPFRLSSIHQQPRDICQWLSVNICTKRTCCSGL